MKKRWFAVSVLLVCLHSRDCLAEKRVFTFDNYSTVSFQLPVRASDGTPVTGARVSLLSTIKKQRKSAVRKARMSEVVFFEGVTDAAGMITGKVRIPKAVKAVDIVVVKPGYHGRYTFGRLRKRWGLLAPALRRRAKVLHDAGSLATAALNLKKKRR